MKLNFTRYQKIILSIYFVVGLPMLPMVPWILFCQWVCSMEPKKVFARENRENLIILTLAAQVTFSLFLGLVVLIVHLLH